MRFQALFKLVRCWRAPNMEYWCVQCATTSSQQLQASERTEYQCFFFVINSLISIYHGVNEKDLCLLLGILANTKYQVA